MARLQFNIEASNHAELIMELEGLIASLRPETAKLGGNSGVSNVVTLDKPRGRGRPRKVATTIVNATKPEPEDDDDEDPDTTTATATDDGEEEDDELTLQEIISRLTVAYQGGDKALKDRIVTFRNSQGCTLLRELKEKHLPAAMQFLQELEA